MDISLHKLSEDFVHTSPYGEINGRKTYLDLAWLNQEAFFSPTIKILDVIGSGEKFSVRYLVNNNPACDCIYIHDGLISKIFPGYHVGEKPSILYPCIDTIYLI